MYLENYTQAFFISNPDSLELIVHECNFLAIVRKRWKCSGQPKESYIWNRRLDLTELSFYIFSDLLFICKNKIIFLYEINRGLK